MCMLKQIMCMTKQETLIIFYLDLEILNATGYFKAILCLLKLYFFKWAWQYEVHIKINVHDFSLDTILLRKRITSSQSSPFSYVAHWALSLWFYSIELFKSIVLIIHIEINTHSKSSHSHASIISESENVQTCPNLICCFNSLW